MLAEAAHDAVAAEIVERLAAEIVALVRVALDALDLAEEPADVVLGGGLLQARDARLLAAIEAELREVGGRTSAQRRGCAADRRRGAARRSTSSAPAPARARACCAASSTDCSGGDAMADVRFDQATRIYPGTDAPAVDALDLTIEDGEFMVLVGPSGSGKTTALRMLAGLEEVDAGAIFIGDRDVTDVAPKDRDVAMVFQNYALYPYLTVEANIGFPLKIARVKKAERERQRRARSRSCSGSTSTCTASRASSPAASASASRWAARSCARRASS